MKTKCPYCNYIADQHETLDNLNPNAIPKEGEISFCIKCGGVSQFFKDELIKIDIESLDEEIKIQIKEIEMAWVKTRNLTKFRDMKESRNKVMENDN